MSDDDGMPPMPPIPPMILEGLFGIKSEETKEKENMNKEANDLRMRTFVENLDEDQVETLRWLINMFAAEGQHNYLTCSFYGILTADLWRRRPIVPENASPTGGSGEDASSAGGQPTP